MAKNLNITTVKLTLNGKEVEWSLQRIRKEAEKTALKMKGMEAGSKEWKEEFKKLEALHKAEQDLIPTLERINHYMQEMGKTATTDIGKAIRELTRMRDAMPGDHKDLQQTNHIIEFFKSWQAQNKNLGMTLEKAKQQLTDLVNTPTEKLKQGLKAIEEEAAKVKNKADRDLLNQQASQYRAQMAINEHGDIKAAPATGSLKSEDRLRAEAERSRLVSAYQTVSLSEDKNHQTWAAQALKEIQQYNSALAALTEAERKDAQVKREQKAAADALAAATKTSDAIARNQKVTIQELAEAQKTYETELKKMEGLYLSPQDQQQVDAMKAKLDAVKQSLQDISQMEINKVFQDLDNQSLETLEATLKKVKEDAATLKLGQDDEIKQAANDIDILTEAIEKFKDKMAGIDQIDFDNLNNVPTEKLEAALKRIEEQEKKLAGTDKAMAEQMAANKTKIINQLNKNKQATIDYANAEQVAAERGKHSVVEMQAAYDALKQKLISLRAEEVEAIHATRKQMKQLQEDIDNVQGKVGGLTKVWKTAVRNIGTYVGVFAGFNYVKGKIEEVIKKNYELSDSLTNVRKVSGLTMKDINQLYTNISQIDTRNTINTLTNLAYQGGKLGIQEYGGVEALTGFVTAAEQVQAALGEDLGEEALPALAKLTENMGLIKSMGVEEAMQKTASAIFALSTSSVSTGQGIVDFSKRLMPVAKSANVTTSELLGLASATESSGLAAEVASTAFVKMFPSIYKNSEALEKYLGLAPGVIREMYDQNRAMDAMVMVFDKMQDMGNLNKYPEIFKLLGSEGARMNTVMSAMANNVDMLRTHLNTSNKAFEEGVAVINEYNLQSNSAAGILERANNIWEKAFVNPEGVDMVKELAEYWYLLSKHVAESDTWMTAFRITLNLIEKIVASLIILLPALIRIMMFTGIVNTIKYVVTNYQDMRKAILAAAGAQGKLNAVMRANAFSLLIGSGLALLSLFWDLYKAYVKFTDATKKLTQEEQDLADAQKMVTDYAKKEVGHLNALYKAATDSLQPMEKRLQWVQQLKKEFPDYFKDLSDEAILTGKAADKYEALAQSLIKAAKARAYKDKMEKISEESVQLQEEVDNDLDYLNQNEKRYREQKAKQEERQNAAGGGMSSTTGLNTATGDWMRYGANDTFLKDYELRENTVLQKQAQIGKNDERIKKLAAAAMENTPAPKPAEFVPGGGGEEESGSGGTTGLSKAMTNEQQKAKAIIDDIKNYYQRQINAVREMANNMDMAEGDTEPIIRHLEERLNTMLSNARMAIGGEKNKWEEFKGEMISDLYEKTDEEGYNFSLNLLNDVMENDLEELRAMILELSRNLNKKGDVLLDQILRKATEDEAKNIKQLTDQRKRVEKALLEMDYTGKVDLNTMNTMEDLGIGGFTSVQNAQFQKWTASNSKEDAEAAREFFKKREEAWYSAFENARKNIAAVIMNPIEQEGDENRLLAILFGENYEETLTGSELEGFLNMTLDQWKVFYIKLLNYNDQWNDAQRKFYEDNKKRQDYLFNNDTTIIDIKNGVKEMEARKSKMQWTGESKGTNFAQQAGFATITEDPELVRLMLLEEQAQRYYDKMEELRQRDLVSQEMVNDARAALDEAEKNRQLELMSLIDDHISKLSQWTEPVQQFATEVGDAMGQAIVSGESMSEAMQNALKSLVKSWGESTIQIVKDLMMQQLKQRLVGKAMVKQEKQTQEGISESDEESSRQRLDSQSVLQTGLASLQQTMGQQILATKQTQDQQEMAEEGTKTQGTVMAGIAQMAATVLGSLGPWGAPLIAVFTALLMGLLSAALSALFGGNKSSSNESAAKTKVKLKSGMLTYDQGNLQQAIGSQWRGKNGEYITDERRTVVGDDGRVYRAREQRSLPEGVSMVTEPIATRVNGQQALVGERGPEIVIGRKTTRAIQMNRPDLLRDLMRIDRGITTRKIRTFDEGNLSDLATALQPAAAEPQPQSQQQASDLTAEDARALTAAIGVFAQTVAAMQKNGIPARIQKYGTGGLIDEVQSGLKFVGQYK